MRRPHPILCLLGLLALSACSTNPVTGHSELKWLPNGMQARLGDLHYARYQQSTGGSYRAHPEVTEYVQEVGTRVAAAMPGDLSYEFVVLNQSGRNAWALPGGKIGITRDFLFFLESEAELAAVLAHEMTHSAANHATSHFQKMALVSAGLSAVDGVLVGITSGSFSSLGSSMISKVVDLSYSRQDELEADHYAVKYLTAAGYDPAAMLALQTRLATLESDAPSGLGEWFSSHPSFSDRLEALKTALSNRDLNDRPSPPSNDARYQQRLASFLSTAPAYHVLEPVPSLMDDEQWPAAWERIELALSMASEDAYLDRLAGEWYQRQGQPEASIAWFTQAIAKDPQYYGAYLARAQAYEATHDWAQATADYEAAYQRFQHPSIEKQRRLAERQWRRRAHRFRVSGR